MKDPGEYVTNAELRWIAAMAFTVGAAVTITIAVLVLG